MRFNCLKASVLVISLLVGCSVISNRPISATSEPSLNSEPSTKLESYDPSSGFDFFLERQKFRPSTSIKDVQLNPAFVSGIQTHIKVAHDSITLRESMAKSQSYFWKDNDFQTLEKNLDGYKHGGFRTYQDGFSTERTFYYNFTQIALTETEEAFEKRIHAWMQAYPQSIVPYSILAEYYMDKGWKARGGGYAKDVTASGRETFVSYYAKALQILEIAESRKIPTDANFYFERLEALYVISHDPHAIQQAFLLGLEKDPDYYPLYNAMALALLYRWHGDSDDLRLFAEWAANNPKQTTPPDVIYAHIAESVADALLLDGSAEEFLSYKFSWPRIRSGFFQEGQYYPMTTLRYDLLCRMAVAHNDAPTAKVLFDNLQNTRYRRVWGNEEYYKAAKAWANTPQSAAEHSKKTISSSMGKKH